MPEATDKKTAAKNQSPALKFKTVKNVTLPLLKPAIDQAVYVKVDGAVFEGKKIDTGEKAKMEPAHLMNCTNLETGEACQMIVPAVLQGIFADEYENDGYVGKCFSITKHAKPSGKRYHPFSVAEIEVE